MKATDLMVGDWVICNYYPDKPCYMQFGVGDFAKCGFEFCDPIPLTAEILEKNGFVRDGTSYILTSRTKWRLNNWFCLMNNSSPHNYKDRYRLIISGMQYKIEFVHQLQHALKLCGIEKEIIL